MLIHTGIITVSDRAAKGLYDDLGGPALKQAAEGYGWSVQSEALVPDEKRDIQRAIREQIAKGCELILTTGGTGVSPRDVTPDATVGVLERVIPGFGEVMRRKSLEKTPNAMISRAIAGIRGRCLIINLPGSPKGAVENLVAVWPAVPHTVAKIQGDQEECAR